MGSKISHILPYIADAVATATGNPELIPLIHGASTKLSGGSWGDSLKNAGMAFAGQEILPAFGNAFSSAFPETASSLGVTGGSNSLTDLLGQTSGGGSLTGAGTIGGDLTGIATRGASGNSTMLSRLLSGAGMSGGTASDGLQVGKLYDGTPGFGGFKPSGSASGFGSGLSGEFASGLGGTATPSSGLGSALLGGTGGGSSSYGGMNTIAALGGAANSLYANDQAKKDLLKSQQQALAGFKPYENMTFNPGDLTKDPGYQFQLEQGNQALGRSEAARGNLNSGAAMKAAQDYGQGLAGTTYNNAYQRWLQGNAQNIGVAGDRANIYTNTGNARANAGISTANITNQTLSSLLSGSGAKRPVNIGGQIYYM